MSKTLSSLVILLSLLQFNAHATIPKTVQQKLLAECEKIQQESHSVIDSSAARDLVLGRITEVLKGISHEEKTEIHEFIESYFRRAQQSCAEATSSTSNKAADLAQQVQQVVETCPPPPESSSSKESRQVDDFIANILSHASLIDRQRSNREFNELITQQPDFVANANSYDVLYSSVGLIGAGGDASVFVATLKHDRPNLGLKAGDRIALRPKTLSVKAKEWESHGKPFKVTLDRAAEVMIRTHQLAVGTKKQKPVTEFFPRIYGIYFSSRIPAKELKIDRQTPPWIKKLSAENIKENCPYFWNMDKIQQQVEMELVDADMEEYFENHKSIPDSIIFETSIGIWAGLSLAGVQILDEKKRNFGVKEVNYYRAYHIGKAIFLFEPGIIPKRLDVGDFMLSSEGRALTRHMIFKPDTTGISKDAQDFLKEDVKSDPDSVFFQRLMHHFSKYKVAEKDLKDIPSDRIKHFYIPESFLKAE